jgi:hypothetical protein
MCLELTETNKERHSFEWYCWTRNLSGVEQEVVAEGLTCCLVAMSPLENKLSFVRRSNITAQHSVDGISCLCCVWQRMFRPTSQLLKCDAVSCGQYQLSVLCVTEHVPSNITAVPGCWSATSCPDWNIRDEMSEAAIKWQRARQPAALCTSCSCVQPPTVSGCSYALYCKCTPHVSA